MRLYIGTDEPRGKNDRIDLYEAFRGVCADEEEFRSQLRLYSRLQGDERLTPKQIPPLVPSHMLLPTAKNKMYNATVLFVNFGGEQKQSTIASTDPSIKRSNEQAMRFLLNQAAAKETAIAINQEGHQVEFKAFVGTTMPDDMKKFLHVYKFGSTPKDQGQLPLIREYIEGLHGDPNIQRWIIIAPQLANGTEYAPWSVPGIGEFSVRCRARVGDTQRRYNVFTESRHVATAEMLSSISEAVTPGNACTAALINSGTAVMLFYPVLSEPEISQNLVPTMGFSLFFPKNNITRRIRYGVRAKDRPSDVTVELKGR